jgi:hypothetical protein
MRQTNRRERAFLPLLWKREPEGTGGKAFSGFGKRAATSNVR